MVWSMSTDCGKNPRVSLMSVITSADEMLVGLGGAAEGVSADVESCEELVDGPDLVDP